MMKRALVIFALVVAMSNIVSGNTRRNGQGETSEQEIRKVRIEWYDAYFRGDTAAMERFETKDIIVISDRGIQKKRQYSEIQKAVKENRWIASGTSIVDDELTIRVQGDTAIVHSLGWTKFQAVLKSHLWSK